MHPLLLIACLTLMLIPVAKSQTSSASSEPWLLLSKQGTTSTDLFKTICDDVGISRQTDATCSGTITDVSQIVTGSFTREDISTLRAKHKSLIDRAIRDKDVTLGDEIISIEDWDVESGPGGRRLPEQLDPVDWGLDMIDQAAMPLNRVYAYESLGTGVNVYVLDTGIRSTHSEFALYKGPPGAGSGGSNSGYSAAVPSGSTALGTSSPGYRVVRAFSAFRDGSSEDCHGHGTHVAAIVGGLTYGVAKNVTLHAVRVLGCDGRARVSDLLQGLDWVARNAKQPAIAHISIQAAFSPEINTAINNLINMHNVHVITSAGNTAADACSVSPASSQAVCVAAVDSSAQRWQMSNWGSCVDIFAPGVQIVSAVAGSDSAATTKTGTSMAAPFATGVAATFLQQFPGASPDDVVARLYRSAWLGSVRDDPQGVATLSRQVADQARSEGRQLMDISATPNRLLQSHLQLQANITPSVLVVALTASAPPSTFSDAHIAMPSTLGSAGHTNPNSSDALGPISTVTNSTATNSTATNSMAAGMTAVPVSTTPAATMPAATLISTAAEPTTAAPDEQADDASPASDSPPARMSHGGLTSMLNIGSFAGMARTGPVYVTGTGDSSGDAKASLAVGWVVMGEMGPPADVADERSTMPTLTYSVTLTKLPLYQVNISMHLPNAWDGSPLVYMSPALLTITPEQYDVPYTVSMTPRVCMAMGDYYARMEFRSLDPFYDGALHSVKLLDARSITGDCTTCPRVLPTPAVAALLEGKAFLDNGDSSVYNDDYSVDAVVGGVLGMGIGPDVVYSLTPPMDMVISISTCGSNFDTVLYAGMAGLEPSQQLASNDDDRGCTQNPSASRLDLRLTAGRPTLFALDGFAGSAGRYVLNVTCVSCIAQPASVPASSISRISTWQWQAV